MDPITAALIAAISAGVMSGLTETSKIAMRDAYLRLKGLLAKKFGNTSDIIHAVEQVESKPDSAGRKATLEEELVAVKAEQDPEILHAAQILLQMFQTEPGAGQHIQQATGHSIAQADRGSSATVSIGHQLDRSKESPHG